MDTNRLKTFATEARKVLMQGVLQRMTAVGFLSDGSVTEEPVLHDGGATFMGDIVSVDFYNQWKSLQHAVSIKSFGEVVEEAAYTWFNRLVAIRIMTRNGIISPVLEYETDDIHIPRIVTDAREGRFPQMDEATRDKLNVLLQDNAQTNAQFRLLIVAYCHANPILYKCFGGISDYTELLLPQNILADGGFVDMLNNTSFITSADFLSPELIGWLYQFYISERKDEVFAKKGKVEADEIPAATQIFTPNWIVKYMVQNTVGRIYLDNNPYEEEVKKDWKYLVEPTGKPADDAIYHYEDLADLKVADLACGSGHILNEFFDLLFELYKLEGYTPKNAVNLIFTHNITGIDIDTRAKQLATFALLLKACQKDSSFADAHCMPHIYDMPEPYDESERGYKLEALLPHFLLGGSNEVIKELTDAIHLMDEARNLGSIMKFNISERTRNIIAVRMDEYEKEEFVPEPIQKIMPYMRIILALTEKYSALVMNPPYMGNNNMNAVLSGYVSKNYEKGKADLCTAFMLMQAERVAKNGYYANIIPPSWMFLSSFERLRKSIIENNVISSLLHLSRGVFGADFGSVSTVIQNRKDANAKGTYFRLIERTFQEFDQKHLELLFEKTLANHDFRYYFADYTKEVTDIVYSENGAKIYYTNVSQQNFEKIPGCPIGYWLSERFINIFKSKNIKDYARPLAGICTGFNDAFLKLWHEINKNNIGTNYNNQKDALNQNTHSWFLHYKGGSFRRWYGNLDHVINYSNKAIQRMSEMKGFRHDNRDFYFKQGLTWSKISSSKSFAVRIMKPSCVFDSTGTSMFPNEQNRLLILGLLNNKIAGVVLNILNPTMAIYPMI